MVRKFLTGIFFNLGIYLIAIICNINVAQLITINSDYILGFEERAQLTLMSDITASSELGLSGNITINSPETLADDEALIAVKKIDFNSKEDLIRQSCFQSYRPQSVGTIVVQGKTGPAENPENYFDALEFLAPSNPVKPTLSSENPPQTWELGDPIVEGNKIIVTPDGRKFLVAQSQLKDIEQQMCKIQQNH